MKIPFKRIYIQDEAAADPLTGRITSACSHLPASVVDSREITRIIENNERDKLLLMRHRGSFVKDFHIPPGSPPCGEKYIVSMLNCPFRCSYCYLQSYLEHRQIIIFTNRERMKTEIVQTLRNNPPRYITTGEYGDSLALDHLTNTISGILPLFEGSNTVLEVRTKSNAVDHLLAAGTTGNLVITWTMAPHEAVKGEEGGTASLHQRLEAIRKCCTAGIPVGIRLDPIIPHYAGMDRYTELLKMIRESTGHGVINRFELGVLRFPAGLFSLIRQSIPHSPLLRGEFFKDSEDKIRLYRPERARIYRELNRSINVMFPRVVVELSMEHYSVWEDSGISDRHLQAVGPRQENSGG